MISKMAKKVKVESYLIGIELSKKNDNYVLTWPKVKGCKTTSREYFKKYEHLKEKLDDIGGRK